MPVADPAFGGIEVECLVRPGSLVMLHGLSEDGVNLTARQDHKGDQGTLGEPCPTAPKGRSASESGTAS